LDGAIFKYFNAVCHKRDNYVKSVKSMVKKTEALYDALLLKRIVSFNDIIQESSKIIGNYTNRGYIYRKYVKRLVENGKLQAIRKGLYAVLSPLEKTEKYEPDKLLIASKIRKNYYLGFHSALEFYGCAYSAFNQAYVCIQARDRFDPFKYKRFTFKPVFVRDVTSRIVEKPYGSSLLRVSSKERTFIECIDRVEYAGGWEECTKSLENLSGINFEKLVNLALSQKRKSLLARTGYMIELLRNRSPFYEHVNDRLLRRATLEHKGQPQYMVRGKKGSLNKRWNLYIPEDFEEELRGI
jgi:predicted transcriptional regulator of viral defense system